MLIFRWSVCAAAMVVCERLKYQFLGLTLPSSAGSVKNKEPRGVCAPVILASNTDFISIEKHCVRSC
jgi:hypothetical protein